MFNLASSSVSNCVRRRVLSGEMRDSKSRFAGNIYAFIFLCFQVLKSFWFPCFCLFYSLWLVVTILGRPKNKLPGSKGAVQNWGHNLRDQLETAA